MKSLAKQSARQKIGPIALVVGLTGGVAACGAGSPVADPGRPRPAETSIPLGTGDPRAREAVVAYENFVAATTYMEKDPQVGEVAYPAAGDFTRFSFDPVQGEYQATIAALSRDNVEFRGLPPVSHLMVTTIDLAALPPAVTLSECRTGRDGWQRFDTTTGKPATEPTPAVPDPDGSTVTVVYERQHWGVKTINQDPARTCSG